ncbi:MAG: Sec-independent protein translocase protein TatB [Thermoanaerobaculia bacterium]
MFGSIGFPELIMIFLVALIVFGPRRLPDIGRSIGKALGEFRRATNELKSTLEEEVRLDETKREVERSFNPDPPPQPAPKPDTPPPAGETAAVSKSTGSETTSL